MNRSNYEIFVYEGSENFTDEMVQEIQTMCGEEGYYFEYTESYIQVRETPWDAETDMVEWSKKYPNHVFEIHSEIEGGEETLFIKNGKFRYLEEKEEYREELLAATHDEIKEVKCFSWTNALFFMVSEVNPTPKSKDEKFIVVGTDNLIAVGTYKKGRWEAPFEVIYWKSVI
ncbi:hypothetical protein PO073_09825 [Bacteroides thetaiotaomicron]|jgi:hypothetical protein|uniref:hypothetical protein n=1 Tax=Bacteroides thetaiotaomicron TaxID=818 RepID=UPI0018A00F7E|nr:hypothetical protein [Bacteroides thetaiotaomicron]MDC2172717.1 hypothetical protein [Bacteroides thetaiotaomicron]MDC2187946.1 hypothetical protein [Bacteroides thetaiotaomicron]